MHDLNGSGQCLLQQASSSQPNLRSQKVTDEQVILSQDTAGTSQQCDNALGSTTTDPATTQPVQPVFSSSTNPALLPSSNPDSQPQSQIPIDITNRHNSTEDAAATRTFQMRLQAKPNAYNTIIHGADIPKRSVSRKPTGQRKPIPTSSDAATKSSPRKPKPRPSPRGAAPKRQRSGTITAKNSTPSTSKSPSRPPATKLKKPNTDKDLRNPLYVSIDPENGTTVPVQQKAKPMLPRKVSGHVNPVLSKAVNGVDVIDDTASPSISNTDTTSMDNSPISVSEQCGFSEATTSSPVSNLSTATLTEDDKGADKEPAAESAVSSVQSAEEPMQYEDNDTLTYENHVAVDIPAMTSSVFDPEMRSMPDEPESAMHADNARNWRVQNALSVLTPCSSSRRVPEQRPRQTTEAAVAQPLVKGPSGVETIKHLMASVNFAYDWRIQVADKDAHTEEYAGVYDEPVDFEPDPPGLYKPETDDEDEDEDDLDDSEATTRVNSRASSVEILEPEASDDSSVEILSAEEESSCDEEVWTSNESSSDEESDSTPYCSDGEYSPVSYLSDGDSDVQYLGPSDDSDDESKTAEKDGEKAADVANKEGEIAADVAEKEGETAADVCEKEGETAEEDGETAADVTEKEGETVAEAADKEGRTAPDPADGETASVVCLSDDEEEKSSDEEGDLALTPEQVAQLKQRFNIKTQEQILDKIAELRELALEAEELQKEAEEQNRQVQLSPKKPVIPRRQMPKLPPKYVGKPKHKRPANAAPVVFKKHIIKKHPMERIYGERMTAEDRAYMRIRRVTRATCRNYIKRWMPNPFETKWYKHAKLIPRTEPQMPRRVVIGNPGELPNFRPIADVPVPPPPKQSIVKPWKDALPPGYLRMAAKYEKAVNDAHVRLRERTEDFHWNEYTRTALRKYDVFWKHLVIRRRPMKSVYDRMTRRQIINEHREELRIQQRANYVMNYFRKLREVRIERIQTFLRKQKKLYLNEKLNASRRKYKKTFWRRYLHRRMWRTEPVARFKAFMMTIAPANVVEEDWDEKQLCLSPTKKKKVAAVVENAEEAPTEEVSNPPKKKGSTVTRHPRKKGGKKPAASRNSTTESREQSIVAPSTTMERESTVPSASDAPAPKRARKSQPVPENLVLHRVIPGLSSQLANNTLPTETASVVSETVPSDVEKRYPARSRTMKKLTYPSEEDAQIVKAPTPTKPPTPIFVTPPPLEDISTDNILPTSKRSVARVTRSMLQNSEASSGANTPSQALPTSADASESVNAKPDWLTESALLDSADTTPVKLVSEGEENVAVSTATRAMLQNPTSVESEPQCKETVVEPPKTLYPCLKSVVAVKPRLPPMLPQVKPVQKAVPIQPTGQPKPAATVSANKPRNPSLYAVKAKKPSILARTSLPTKPANNPTAPVQALTTTANLTPAVNGVPNEASGQDAATVPDQSPMKTVRPMPIVKDKTASQTPSTKLPGQKPAIKKLKKKVQHPPAVNGEPSSLPVQKPAVKQLKRKIQPTLAVNGEPSASTTQLPQSNGSPTKHETTVPTAIPMPVSNAVSIVPDEPKDVVPLPSTEATATVQDELPTANEPPKLMVTGIPTLLTLPAGCTTSSEVYMMKLFEDLLTEFTQDGVQKSPDLVTKHLESVMITFGNEVTSLHYLKLRQSITTDWMKIKYPLDFRVTQEEIETGIVLSVEEAQNAVNYICALNGSNLPTAHTKYQELRDKYKTDWKRVTFPPPEYFDKNLPGSSSGFAGYASVRTQYSTPVKNGQNALSASNSSNNSPHTEAYKRNLRVIVPTPPKKQRVDAAPAEAQKTYNQAIADLRNAVFNEKK